MRLGRATRARKENVDAASAIAITDTQSAACWGPSVTHLETRGFESRRTLVQEDVGRAGTCTTNGATRVFHVKPKGGHG